MWILDQLGQLIITDSGVMIQVIDENQKAVNDKNYKDEIEENDDMEPSDQSLIIVTLPGNDGIDAIIGSYNSDIAIDVLRQLFEAHKNGDNNFQFPLTDGKTLL